MITGEQRSSPDHCGEGLDIGTKPPLLPILAPTNAAQDEIASVSTQ
jgi:hypothetical protein